jgi:hypothetical protein
MQSPSLTAMDHIQIRQLAARFTHALDSAADQGRTLAALFTADGELALSGVRGGGRDAIAAAARADVRRGPSHVARFAMNHLIDATADGAVGRQHVVEMRFPENAGGRGRQGQAGGAPVNQWDLVGRVGGELIAAGARYEDVYVKTPDGWRFRRRELSPGGAAGGTAISTARAPATPPRAARDDGEVVGGLTALDYLEIEQLVASYGHALDSGFNAADNGDAYAGLFVPGAGTFFSRGRPVQGPTALSELARAQPHSSRYVRHYLSDHVISRAPDGRVSGRQHLVVVDVGENGAPTTIFLGGYYEDVYLKTARGWRFLERRSFGARAGS